ncbi:MAG: NADH-quinone oxidoreductase subunit C [Synergistales bacterium]|nr:NADH-quinone oxidoreductase subunit C [Synergistales bacterium]
MTCRVEYVKESRDPREILSCVEELLGEDLLSSELREKEDGREGTVQYHDLRLTVPRARFLELVDRLGEIDAVHFHVMSGNDDGDTLMVQYHLALFRSAGRGTRLGVHVKVHLDKEDLTMPSLWSRIPGVEYSEREMREFFGIDFEGLPNKALVFLPEDWDESIKPWRRDETGPGDDVVRELS